MGSRISYNTFEFSSLPLIHTQLLLFLYVLGHQFAFSFIFLGYPSQYIVFMGVAWVVSFPSHCQSYSYILVCFAFILENKIMGSFLLRPLEELLHYFTAFKENLNYHTFMLILFFKSLWFIEFSLFLKSYFLYPFALLCLSVSC